MLVPILTYGVFYDRYETAVVNWLQSVPTTSVAPTANRDMIHACMPATSAETLMGTEFHQFQHSATPHEGYRAATPLSNVPPHIANLIDFIGGANTPIHRYECIHIPHALY
jgi:hypothetical protein